MKYQPLYSGDPALREELLRIAAVLEALGGNLEVRHVAPDRPRLGQVCICDGTAWNPLGDNVQRPIWFDGIDWQAFG